jgi:hypothetical protein
MNPIYTAWLCQIDITSKCFMSCLYCSRYNRHLRDDQRYDMPLDVFADALTSLAGWPSKIGIIGGEPLLHNHFEECCTLIQSKFPREKMALMTSGGPTWPKYNQIAVKTFGLVAYNQHTKEQQQCCRHQRLTVAVKDVIKDEQYMNELIDDCWVQRTWCPTISAKGAFFCEIAGAQDFVWDGPGGYPIELGWWVKTPEQFKDQRDRYCPNCGMCVPMERDLISCGIEKMSPTVYANMMRHSNIRIDDKHVELFDKQFTIDEVEAAKLTWYPGNYRGDRFADCDAPEGMGATIFRRK